jgi:hypothetical protein
MIGIKRTVPFALLLLLVLSSQARAQNGVSVLVPAGNGSDAISSNGTDPKTWDPKLDATIAAPANHRIIYEDDDVRVLLVTLRPGEREKPHDHPWPSIMVILGGSPRVGNLDAQGAAMPIAMAQMPANLVLPLVIRTAPEALHSNYNPDPSRPFRAIRIEFKHGFPKH